jgi:hypothetical protein
MRRRDPQGDGLRQQRACLVRRDVDLLLLVKPQRLLDGARGLCGAAPDRQHIGKVHQRVRTIPEEVALLGEPDRLEREPLALLGVALS